MIGFYFPYEIAIGTPGYLRGSKNLDEAIKSNVRSLLTTNRGERLMHMDLGCSLQDFLFEKQDNSTKSSIADRIKSQFSKWLPYLTIKELFISFSSERDDIGDQGFIIEMKFSYGNIDMDLSLIMNSVENR